MFAIVKYTDPVYTECDQPPTVMYGDSAAMTYTGRVVGIQDMYDDFQVAKRDCDRMNRANPSGYYNVCPVRL